MPPKNRTMQERYLPGDFHKIQKDYYDHYNALDNNPKSQDLEGDVKGFFAAPDEMVGKTNFGIRPFLVFYFETEEDYETVRKALELHGTKSRSHPALNTPMLIEWAKQFLGSGEQDA